MANKKDILQFKISVISSYLKKVEPSSLTSLNLSKFDKLTIKKAVSENKNKTSFNSAVLKLLKNGVDKKDLLSAKTELKKSLKALNTIIERENSSVANTDLFSPDPELTEEQKRENKIALKEGLKEQKEREKINDKKRQDKIFLEVYKALTSGVIKPDPKSDFARIIKKPEINYKTYGGAKRANDAYDKAIYREARRISDEKEKEFQEKFRRKKKSNWSY